jgi:hypothetical protein
VYQYLGDLDTSWRWDVGPAQSSADVARLKEAFVERMRVPMRVALDPLFERLTLGMARAGEDERRAAASLYRQLVQPYWLQSRFVRRSADRPLGYAGDFGVGRQHHDGPDGGGGRVRGSTGR